MSYIAAEGDYFLLLELMQQSLKEKCNLDFAIGGKSSALRGLIRFFDQTFSQILRLLVQIGGGFKI